MTSHSRLAILALAAASAAGLLAAAPRQTAPQQPAPPPQQPSAIELSISGEPGTPPRFAVPDFVALSGDAETQAIAKTLGQVLWDDLNFEREFYLIPRDTYASVPVARSADAIPFAGWRELGCAATGTLAAPGRAADMAELGLTADAGTVYYVGAAHVPTSGSIVTPEVSVWEHER